MQKKQTPLDLLHCTKRFARTAVNTYFQRNTVSSYRKIKKAMNKLLRLTQGQHPKFPKQRKRHSWVKGAVATGKMSERFIFRQLHVDRLMAANAASRNPLAPQDFKAMLKRFTG